MGGEYAVQYTRSPRKLDDTTSYLTFLRRKVNIEPVTGRSNTFNFRFPDSSSLFGDQIYKDDWIIADGDLWVVHTVSPTNEIALIADSNPQRELVVHNAQDKAIEGVYYQRLDPCTYYFYMLAIYIHHIFFVGLGDTTKSKAQIVNIAQGATTLAGSSQAVVLNLSTIRRADAERKLDPILIFAAQMYTCLLFSDNDKSYYRQGRDNLSRVLPILKDARELQDMIEDFLGYQESEHGILDRLTKELDRPGAGEKATKTFSDKLDFSYLLRSIITVTIERPRGFHLW